MQKKLKSAENRRMDVTDKGFSLIEVLVCIAVIAIICVPIFKSFQLSATLNNKAHYTQQVTAYAQKELEVIKSTAVAEYRADFESAAVKDGVTYAYITSGDEWDALNTEAQTAKGEFSAPAGMTEDEKDALFKPFICEKKDIKIGGRKYTMHAKFRPAAYSKIKETTAANVNVAGFYEIAQADAVKYPVVSQEINSQDVTCVEKLQEKLLVLGETKTEAEIMQDMQKTVEVIIKESAGSLKVRCDVAYAYPKNSPTAEIKSCVYRGSYEYEADEEKKVFLFAKAFRDLGNACENKLLIKTSMSDGSAPNADIYFVLGHGDTDDTLYNFKDITVYDVPYVENYDVKVTAPGKMPLAGDKYFYTNIKKNGSELEAEDNGTVGTESYQATGYAVEIEMYDQTDGNKRAAHLEAAKTDR